MKKRRSRGFTLVEMLVATLILGMVSLCVMLGTSSAQKVYRETLFASESEILGHTLNAAVGGILRYALFNEEKDATAHFTYEGDYGSVKKGYFLVQDSLLYLSPNDSALPSEGTLLQILGKSAYVGLRIRDFIVTYADGVFSGTYTIYHPIDTRLTKAMSFTFRTIL